MKTLLQSILSLFDPKSGFCKKQIFSLAICVCVYDIVRGGTNTPI